LEELQGALADVYGTKVCILILPYLVDTLWMHMLLQVLVVIFMIWRLWLQPT